MWLSISTRPDISNAVRAVARNCTAPRAIHCKGVLGILDYINGTSDYGITFQRGILFSISLEVFGVLTTPLRRGRYQVDRLCVEVLAYVGYPGLRSALTF